MPNRFTRREAAGLLFATAIRGAAPPPNTRQATGLRIGEVKPDSAVVWTRRTAASSRLADGVLRKGSGKNARPVAPGEDVNSFEGACPGAAGEVRLRIEPAGGKGRRQTLDWLPVDARSDYARSFRVEGLAPATEYRFAVETRETARGKADAELTGSFRTAPSAGDRSPLRFALSSCQKYSQMDRPDGFAIYSAIEKSAPAFLLSCGDNVYYDSDDPVANSVAAARYHWQRMYSLPTLHSCLRSVPGYWQKDDHDLYTDDCWPGRDDPKMLPFNFVEGQGIFREQTPGPPPEEPFYRRFRWGADLEVFLPEARDYRSPNDAPDGADKSIWGETQRRWLENALTDSTARWKFLINPNPIVGPDHARKNDNHANPAFATESLDFRRWLKANVDGSVILMNGDRHWQYHSVDPDYGVHEFGCGPASDSHAIAPSRGEDPRFHRFLRIAGGYVQVTVDPRSNEAGLVVEHCDVDGRTVNRAVFPPG